MGAEQSILEKQTNLKDFPTKYKPYKNFNSLPYGQGVIYQKSDDPNFVRNMRNQLFKKFIIQKSYLAQQSKSKLLSIDHPFIISCIGSISSLDETQICGGQDIQKFIYQYYPRNLADEIERRTQLNKKFTEQEIWYLFFSLAQVGQILQKYPQNRLVLFNRNNKYHSDFRPNNILLTENNQIRVTPYGTFPKDVTGYQRALELKQVVYLSPEALNCLQQKAAFPYINQLFEKLYQNIRFKSDVFSIAVTILEAMSLVSGQHLYNLQSLSIEEQRVKLLLEKCLDDYSELLVRTIASLFTKNLDKRPDFIQLYNQLEPYSIKILQLQPFNFDLESAKKKHQESPERYQKPIEIVQFDEKSERYNQGLLLQKQEQDQIIFLVQLLCLQRNQSTQCNFPKAQK